ncbi:MAG: 3'-5' exonuclease, partial [Opitutales bacterium]|nr:3'-5' exonuclease [Opitutales bacterium]
MKKINIPIYAIDFEGSRKIGVVEYGVAKIVGGEIVSAETSLCAPKMKIPQRDADFFGIDNDEASKFPPFSESVKRFQAMRKDGIFLAHNAIVEDGLLRDAMPSPAIVPNFVDANNTSTWSPWIDSCVLLKRLYPTLETAKLSSSI